LKVSGTNIFIANGPAAGQRSQHFMVHLIPRKEGDKIFNFEEKLIDKEMRQKVKLAVGGRLKELLGVKEEKQEKLVEPEEKEEDVEESDTKEDEDTEDVEADEDSQDEDVEEDTEDEDHVEDDAESKKNAELDNIADLFK